MSDRARIGLALGGGGARGLAHVGVLRALEERGYAIDAIAGCSMGGLVGALLGSGFDTRAMVELAESTSFKDLLDFGAHGGLIGGKAIGTLIRDHVRETFEDLDVPLKVTTVDVQRGTLVVIGSGELAPALRASSALPGIMRPVRHLDRVLIDGGLLDNLPIGVVRTMTLHPVVAVDVAAPPDRHLDFDGEHGLIDAIKRIGERRFRSLTVELFMKSFDIPQRFITDTRLAMDPPELLIRPDLPVDFGIEDMHRLEEAVEIGYRTASERLDAWEAADRT